jgi:hypothetical protein
MADITDIIQPGLGGLNSDDDISLMNHNDSPILYKTSLSGQYQTAVNYGGYIYTSSDYGETWTAKDSSRNWVSISLSFTGQYQSAVVSSGQIYISSDYGDTWTAKDSNRNWKSISLSSTGQYQSATVSSGQIYVSSDYGETWTAKDSNRAWIGISLSSTGQYQSAVVAGGQIYVSSDYGDTWTAKDSSRSWVIISISAIGQYQTATVSADYIYISSDYGNTWTAKDSVRDWTGISISSTGQYQSATVNGGQIYISSDYGETWTAKESNQDWLGISISSTGQYQSATILGEYIYVSSDYGNTWTKKGSSDNWYAISINSGLQYYDSNNLSRLNIEYIDGSQGIISNAEGNAIQTKTLPSGTNKIHGTCPDIENNAIIYFIQNSNDDDCIIRYKYNGTFENISYEEDWGFDENYPITKAQIIGDGIDAQLCWTDNYTEPRKINIYNVENAVYSSLHEGNINTYKPYGLFKPTLTFGDDTAKNINNLRTTLFQFCIRYVYDTKEKSAWGLYSELSITPKNEFIAGILTKNIQVSNKLTLTITVDYDNIDYIEIAFRNVDVGSGVYGLWALADVIDASYPTTTYTFYNDKNYSPLLQEDFLLVFHDVPLTAYTQEVISSNRLCYGKIKKGYDNVDINVTLTAKYHDVYEDIYNNKLLTSVADSANLDLIILKDTNERYNEIILTVDPSSLYEIYILESDINQADLDAVIDYFVAKINAETNYNITASRSTIYLRIANATGNTLYVTHEYQILQEKRKTLKDGSTIYLGLRYYFNGGRLGGVNISDDSNVYIEFPTERSISEDRYITGIEFQIEHNPPTGATHYQWMFGGCSVNKAFRVPLIITSGTYIINHTPDITKENGLIYIDINAVLDRINTIYYNANIVTFDVIKGDRIRIIGECSLSTGVVSVINEYIDLEILNVDGYGKLVISDWNSYTNASTLNTPSNGILFVEFYRPLSINTESIVYREIGDLLPITGGYHTINNLDVLNEGKYQSATVNNGKIYVSSDYGETWTAKDSNRAWIGISLSSTGQYQSATVDGGQIYVSSDYGETWTAKDSNRDWHEISLSATGKYQTAIVLGGQIYVSSDYGETWTAKDSSRLWRNISISATGQYQTAVVSDSDYIYISSDYGNTWTAKGSSQSYFAISVSATGQYQTAGAKLFKIYISSDYGETWTAKDYDGSWSGISLSATGQYQTATAIALEIYVSSDYGETWTAKDSSRNYEDVSISATGQYQSVITHYDYIYVSSDYGETWTAKDSSRDWQRISINYGASLFTITSQNQTAVLPAIGYINFGNYYRYSSRCFLDSASTNVGYLSLYSEFESFSLLYNSRNAAYGRLGIFDKNYAQKTYNAVVFGKTYSDENLNFNELNKFDPEDIKYIDDKYGNIYGLEEKGYVLNVIQRSKVTHIDIDRIQTTLPDGSISYVVSNKVLGSKRPSPTNFGCIFPFSIQDIYGLIYFYDIYSADVCIIHSNGINSITDGQFKMRKYFRDKSNALLNSGLSNIVVSSGHDPINNLYVLTFIDSVNTANNETIAFHIPSQRWITFYSYIPQRYAKIGDNIFLTFTSNGILYKHHIRSLRNIFYGTSYDSIITIVSNKNPDIKKIFTNIKIYANDRWEAPDNDSIIVNQNAIEHSDDINYTKHYNRMQSELIKEQFQYNEGEFEAEFLRDNTTTTGIPVVKDLINGRELRGYEIIIRLENDNSSYVYLKTVKIYSLISE